MEIAATGFMTSFGSAASADSARQRQTGAREQVVREQPNPSRIAAQSPATDRSQQAPRIIDGEVLSSETSRVRADQSPANFLGRSSSNQQAPNDQPATRRVSVQQAMQNFVQNETLQSDASMPRQVSGIIDVYV
jgi:hypothetical protein